MSDGLEAVLAAACESWTTGFGRIEAVDGEHGDFYGELADAIRAAGWRKAPQEACTAGCGDGGGAGEELGLREPFLCSGCDFCTGRIQHYDMTTAATEETL